ncbi:MAG TPA: hypothetical protein VHE99_09435 [Gammaproteobacteria bacterium]|nr:hypothetical protein [Gammaproteobacteria bacterium]
MDNALKYYALPGGALYFVNNKLTSIPHYLVESLHLEKATRQGIMVVVVLLEIYPRRSPAFNFAGEPPAVG